MKSTFVFCNENLPGLGWADWFPNKDMAWFKTLKYWSDSQSEWSCSLCPCRTRLEEKLKLNIDQRIKFIKFRLLCSLFIMNWTEPRPCGLGIEIYFQRHQGQTNLLEETEYELGGCEGLTRTVSDSFSKTEGQGSHTGQQGRIVPWVDVFTPVPYFQCGCHAFV